MLEIRVDLPPAEDWPVLERLRHEFDAIGFYLSAHPLDAYEDGLARLQVMRYADLEAADRDGPGFRKLAGIVVGKQERTSRTSQNRFAFVQLTDSSGVFEVVIFQDLLNKTRELLESGQPLLLTVDVRRDAENLRLMAQEIQPLDQAAASKSTGIRIFLREAQPLPQIKSPMERESGGCGRVNLVLDLADGREAELVLPAGKVFQALRQAVKAGRGSISGPLERRKPPKSAESLASRAPGHYQTAQIRTQTLRRAGHQASRSLRCFLRGDSVCGVAQPEKERNGATHIYDAPAA